MREELFITQDRPRNRTDSARATFQQHSPLESLAARAIGAAHAAVALHLAETARSLAESAPEARS